MVLLTKILFKNAVLFFTLFIGESSKYSLEATVVQGTLWTHKNWMVVAEFCFANDGGKFGYDVRYDETYAVQNIALYYDTQWEKSYEMLSSNLTTCMQKESVLQVSISVLAITYRPE